MIKRMPKVIIRSTWTSYVALAGIWILLTIAYWLLSLRSPGHNLETGGFITGGVAILWIVWLRGFKITVSNGFIEYRDGFFRSSRLALTDIADIKTESAGWNMLSRKMVIPRIVMIARSGEEAIRINPKPFGRDLQRILKEMKKTKR